MDRLAYRIPEVAEMLGVSRSKAYALVASGDIPSLWIGKSRRVPVEALNEWIQNATANRVSAAQIKLKQAQREVEKARRRLERAELKVVDRALAG